MVSWIHQYWQKSKQLNLLVSSCVWPRSWTREEIEPKRSSERVLYGVLLVGRFIGVEFCTIKWWMISKLLTIFGPLEGCCCLWGKVRNSLLFFQPSTKCLLVLSILFTWSFWNSYIFCEELNQPDYPHSSSSTASSVESVMLYCFSLHQYTPWELWLSSQMVVLFFIY